MKGVADTMSERNKPLSKLRQQYFDVLKEAKVIPDIGENKIADDIRKMNAAELKQAIAASTGEWCGYLRRRDRR
jgi:hypothetical protein